MPQLWRPASPAVGTQCSAGPASGLQSAASGPLVRDCCCAAQGLATRWLQSRRLQGWQRKVSACLWQRCCPPRHHVPHPEALGSPVAGWEAAGWQLPCPEACSACAAAFPGARPAECIVESCVTRRRTLLLLHVVWHRRWCAALCYAGWQSLAAVPELAWLWQSQATAAKRRPVQMLQQKGYPQLSWERRASLMDCPQ